MPGAITTALIYRNVTSHSCTVYGYPGLDAISGTGHVLAHATRTLSGYGSGGHLATVTIRPGGFATSRCTRASPAHRSTPTSGRHSYF